MDLIWQGKRVTTPGGGLHIIYNPPTPGEETLLTMTWDNISSVPVTNPESLSEWNTWFDLPTQGDPFTGVEVTGNEVKLSGGKNITLPYAKFGDSSSGPNLLSITDTGAVKTLGDGVFSYWGDEGYGCPNLTTASFDKVETIGDYVFAGCTSLTDFTIPDTTTSMVNGYSFYDCTNLTDIQVSPTNNNFSDVNGVLFNKTQTTLLEYPWGKTQTSYSVPSGTLTLAYYSFTENPSLQTVTLNSELQTIGEGVFSSCASLTGTMTLPNSVTSIGNSAFSYTNITSITLSSNLTTIGSGTFYGCTNLTSITIPNNVTTLGNAAFGDCTSLSSVTLSSNITHLSDQLFRGTTALHYFTIPSTITSMGYGVFYSSGLYSIVIPDTVTSMDTTTFRDSHSLSGVTWSNSITAIPADTFQDCRALSAFTWGTNVTSIGQNAFREAIIGFPEFNVPATVTSIGDSGLIQSGAYSTSAFNFYPMTAPTLTGQVFSNWLTIKPTLHIKSGATGYNVAPWTDTAVFSSIVQDL